jgi:hypothetical protein
LLAYPYTEPVEDIKTSHDDIEFCNAHLPECDSNPQSAAQALPSKSLNITAKAFYDDLAEYCGSRSPVSSRASNGSGNQGASRLLPSAPGVTNGTGALTAQEFHQSVKRDIAHYLRNGSTLNSKLHLKTGHWCQFGGLAF